MSPTAFPYGFETTAYRDPQNASYGSCWPRIPRASQGFVELVNLVALVNAEAQDHSSAARPTTVPDGSEGVAVEIDVDSARGARVSVMRIPLRRGLVYPDAEPRVELDHDVHVLRDNVDLIKSHVHGRTLPFSCRRIGAPH